jgi:hypothetical protein
MYKIASKTHLPTNDLIPLRVIINKRLAPESIRLAAYIINEWLSNPDNIFQKNLFMKVTGLRRRQTNNAIQNLIDKQILSIYKEQNDESVYELDYTSLMEIANPQNLNTIEKSNYNADRQDEQDD